VVVSAAVSSICGVAAGPWLKTREWFQFAVVISACIMFGVALDVPDVDPNTIYSPSDPQYASLVPADRPSLLDAIILSFLSVIINLACFAAMLRQKERMNQRG